MKLDFDRAFIGLIFSIVLLIIVAGVWGSIWDPHVGDGLYDYGVSLINATSVRDAWGGSFSDIGVKIWAITPLLIGLLAFSSALYLAHKTAEEIAKR